MTRLFRKWQDKKRARHSGFKKQGIDERDHEYVSGKGRLRRRVDLRPYFRKARRQGKSEACTAFATTSLLEYKMTRIRGLNNKYYLSPLYNWYYSKLLHWGTADINKGVWLRYALKAVYHEGLPPENLMPFYNWNKYPDPGIEAEAFATLFKKYLVKTHYTLLQSRQVKDALAREIPVEIGRAHV